MNYSSSEIEFIKNNNPLITHQLIIPKDEFLRLSDKFDQIDQKIEPDLMIINNQNEILNKVKLTQIFIVALCKMKVIPFILKKL